MNELSKTGNTFYQGDVPIERIEAVDVESILRMSKEVTRDSLGRLVLMEGEMTGHAHAVKEVDARMFLLDNGTLLLWAPGPVKVEHEEHDTVNLPSGFYRVGRQVEYAPKAIRNVAD